MLYFYRKQVKPGVEFVNNFAFYMKNDDFKFYLKIIIMAFVYASVNIFHRINFLQKDSKVNMKHSNNISFSSLFLHQKRNLEQQKLLSSSCQKLFERIF